MQIKEESVLSIKIKYVIGCLIIPLLNLFKALVKCLARFYKLLSDRWVSIYHNFCSRKKYYKDILIKINIIVSVGCLLIFLTRKYYFNKIDYTVFNYAGYTILGSLGLIISIWLFYQLIGKNELIKYYVLATEHYVCHGIAKIVKIFGPPRIGKDTTMISMMSILVRFYNKELPRRMKRLKSILYIFDFYMVNNFAILNRKKFSSGSKKKTREAFLNLIKDDHVNCFLKDYFKDKIKIDDFINDYIKSLDDKINVSGSYIYDSGINKRHFLDLLYEYIILFVRRYVLKNFSITNQPYLENPKTGLTAKEFSIYYISTKSGPNVKRNNIEYEEKVLFPLLPFTIIAETENDTWYNNLDGVVASMIKEAGIRDFKAMHGHFYEELRWFQVCHDASRMSKQLREMDACYINILNREEIPGAPITTSVLSFIQKPLASSIEGREVKIDYDNDNKITYRRQRKIEYYDKLYKITQDDYYKARSSELVKREYKQPGPFFYFRSKLNKILLSLIEQLKFKKGYIKITCTISDNPGTSNLSATTISKLSTRTNPLYHESFKVDLYFKMSDSMGRYNHRYLEELADERAGSSWLNFGDIENWAPKMAVDKAVILRMGYPQATVMFKIDAEEIFKYRYVKK